MTTAIPRVAKFAVLFASVALVVDEPGVAMTAIAFGRKRCREQR